MPFCLSKDTAHESSHFRIRPDRPRCARAARLRGGNRRRDTLGGVVQALRRVASAWGRRRASGGALSGQRTRIGKRATTWLLRESGRKKIGHRSPKCGTRRASGYSSPPLPTFIYEKRSNEEIRVDRVLFVGAKKLPHIRRRLHIPFPVSKWRHVCQEDFKEAPSLAIIHHAGKPNELSGECLRMVREESLILTVSQLGYARRSNVGHVGLYGEVVSQGLIISSSTDRTRRSLAELLDHGPSGLDADDHWRNGKEVLLYSPTENSPQDNLR